MGESFEIVLRDILLRAHIGVAEQERKVGNEFRVNLNLRYPASEFRTEDLSSTISYADLHAIVEEEMRKEWLLLESAAVAITERVTTYWQQITELAIAIDKVAPPISGIVGECGIKYFWKKS